MVQGPAWLSKRAIPLLLPAVFVTVALSLPADDVELPDGKGRDAVEAACTVCHTAERIAKQRLTQDQWRSTLREMIENGASLNPDQWEPVVAYLAKNFGPKVNVNSGTAEQLAAGLHLTTPEAQAIVACRTVKGAFKDLADLEKVPGLDARKIEAERDQIEF